MFLDLRDFSFIFFDVTVISSTTEDSCDHENSKVLKSGSWTEITNQIKETMDEEKEIISNIKKIPQTIKGIV
jgi:hypothetical protein